MPTLANRQGCIYRRHGLAIRLHGYPMGVTGSVSAAERIENLHRAIAISIIEQPGLLSGKHIRYLRRELGYTPEELADRIDMLPDMIRNAENTDAFHLPLLSDVELRRLIYTHFDQEMPLIQYLCKCASSGVQGDTCVRVTPDNSGTNWRIAA